MKYHSVFAAAGIFTLAALPILHAQVAPNPPVNLRVAGNNPPSEEPPPPPCDIPASGGTAHAYFDALVRLPQHVCNASLRSQAQLNSLVADPVAINFSYAPLSDTYPDKQDAAKFYIFKDNTNASVPGGQQLRVPLNKPSMITSGTVLLTFDWYWGSEFRDNSGGVTHYKTFQYQVGGKGWWTMVHSPGVAVNTPATDDVAVHYDAIRAGMDNMPGAMPAGMNAFSPVSPAGPGVEFDQSALQQAFPIRTSRWHRYWVEIKLVQPPSAFTEWNAAYGVTLQPNPNDPQGRWHMLSVWIADEDRPAQRVLYRVPMNWNAQLWDPWPTTFKFEMNSSKDGATGPFVGYGRNVVVLRDYALPNLNPESDTLIFQKPIR